MNGWFETMIREKLIEYTNAGNKTLLGVGPMSVNTVDVTIKLANQYKAPLMLIASRRQIDSDSLGGGYVNNWTTEEFSSYVKKNDLNGNVILARDHGGPWQNELEKQNCNSLAEAMESAKRSYEVDIKSGFKVIHIDPSVGKDGPVSKSDSLDRALELYKHCWDFSREIGADIAFEIGTEEQQAGGVATLDELTEQLQSITEFCMSSNIPLPLYVVVQTGTKVMELRNIGSFDSPVRVAGQVPAEIMVPKIVDACKSKAIFLKQHNTDYLSDNALKAHPYLGIHAANVAPEFGVAETIGFLKIIDDLQLRSHRDKFVELSVNSGKWKKWMLPDTSADDLQRAIISGHYIFAKKEFLELKDDINLRLKRKGLHLDNILKSHIKQSIMRYLTAFRLAK